MTVTAVVLASASPRRAELLTTIGVAFTVRVADVDETPRPGEDPLDYVARVARDKARAVANPGEVVIAADTTVVLDGEILGKPADAREAEAMLRRLAGQGHRVSTAVVLHDGRATPTEHVRVETTEVELAALSDDEIGWYVATGEPLDKAGGYGLQGIAGMFVRRVDGSPSNVIGLPLHVVRELLAEIGLPLHGSASPDPR